MKIYSQTPVRIGLIGGGTDVNPFAAKYQGKVLSLAIDIYNQVTLIPRRDSKVVIATILGKREFNLNKKLIFGQDKKFDLIYSLINYYKPKLKTGLALKVDFKGKSAAGLGSSGSLAVCIIGAFNQWLGIKMSLNKIALLAWRRENQELGWICGKQDPLAACFGGVNILSFGPGKERFTVKPLKLSKKVLTALKDQTIMFYLGQQRHSGVIQKKLQQGMSETKKVKALLWLKNSVDKAADYLINQDFVKLGQLLDKAWSKKKQSNPAVSNKRIDQLYSKALKLGALGGKVMGAGQGGYMLFLCPATKRDLLIKNLKTQGLEVVDFNFDFSGLKVKIEK